MDMGQYFMDMVMHLTGWPKIVAVSASTFKHFPHDLPDEVVFNVEEHCTILARAENGCTFTFDFAWMAHHEPQNNTMLLGTEGGIRMGDGTPFVYYNEPQPWHWMNQTTEWKNKVRQQEVIYEKLAAIDRGEDVYVGTSAEEALAITELTDMAFISAGQGREVSRAELE